MELNHQKVDMVPRAAATVVLLREGPSGPQVFMVKRHGMSDVLAGAMVFPGGKVDAEDSEPQAIARFAQQRDFVRLLGEPELTQQQAAGIVFAACRETFEECGVLLGVGVDAGMQTEALAMMREGLSFLRVVTELDLKLDSTAIHAWTRWITPVIPSLHRKRFDTRFLVVRQPAGQQAVHDEREASDGDWQVPLSAMQAFWAGDIELAPPQIMTLQHMSRYPTIEQILGHAASRPPPVILPESFELEGTRVVAYPGDPMHPIRERAMPGPTRLAYRAGRFEPFEGYEAFFA